MTPDGLSDLEEFLASAAARRFTADRKLISTRRLAPGEGQPLFEQGVFAGLPASREAAGALFEHERVAFPSYPYEWTAGMLWAAGELTLDLAENALPEGFGLKDATPYNVLFRGPQPVFVDVLSFERRAPGDAVWRPYAQFVRTFLLPLLAHRVWGLRLADLFLTHRDGIEPAEVFRMCGPLQKLRPPFLTLVSLPTWLSRRAPSPGIYQARPLADDERARFVVRAVLGRLRRSLRRLKPPAGTASTWTNYMEAHSYSDAAFAAKQEFVTGVLREFAPRQVLDLGTNTGHFSMLAAGAGAEVVAVDQDEACVSALWQRARAEGLAIQPLVIDLGRPSPAVGWRNRECATFLDRARGAFDAVLMLALLHHLLVTERVPLAEILELAAELTRDLAVIEFVAPGDEMFRRLLRGREALFADLDATAFERACRVRFEIVRTVPLPGGSRRLYLLRKRAMVG